MAFVDDAPNVFHMGQQSTGDPGSIAVEYHETGAQASNHCGA
jgi:hypothetical protein